MKANPEAASDPSEQPDGAGEPGGGEQPGDGEQARQSAQSAQPEQPDPSDPPDPSEQSAQQAGRSGEPGTERLERAVRAAETALIEYEIAVETFRIEVENFSRLHHQRLGPMYARLDELDARIAEATAALTGDPDDLHRAREARALVMPMPGVDELFHGWVDSDGMLPEATAMLNEQPVQPPSRVRPSEEARKAYRELVRKAHPDLAQDDAERKRREDFLVRVNKAYTEGDADALHELLEEWAAGPKEPAPEPPRSELLYARLEWLALRKEELAAMAAEMEESAIGAMLRMAPDDPDALLDEIAEQLLAQVEERQRELDRLLEQLPDGAGPAEATGTADATGAADSAGAADRTDGEAAEAPEASESTESPNGTGTSDGTEAPNGTEAPGSSDGRS